MKIRQNDFAFLMTKHNYVSHVCKLPKGLKKNYQLFARIPYNGYSGKYIKI